MRKDDRILNKEAQAIPTKPENLTTSLPDVAPSTASTSQQGIIDKSVENKKNSAKVLAPFKQQEMQYNAPNALFQEYTKRVSPV